MSSAHDKSPGVHIPPPLVYAAGLGLGLWLNAYFRTVWLPWQLSQAFGWILVAAALLLAGSAIALFARAGTTIRPDRPASILLSAGPYRFTRNPMYVSLALLYAGIAIMWQSLWAMVLLPLVLLYIDRRVIRAEEAFLERKFGPSYTGYRAHVRRWI